MNAPASILVLSGVQGDTRRYRTFHFYEQLRLAGIDCQLSHVTDPDLPGKVVQAGIVLFHRVTLDTCMKRLFQVIEARRSLCLLDVDDLVFDPSAFRWIDSPDFQDPLRAALYQEDMRRNRLALEKCQAVTASTDYLAEQVRALGKPAWVHRNAFSLEMLALSRVAFQAKPAPASRLVIGYASGTPTHDRDFEVAKPALQQVMRRYPQVELWIVGPLDPGRDWEGLESRVRRHRFLPWRQLPALLAQFDINLAPLVLDNPFARSKSEIKYVEAGLVHVPTVASPTQAFCHAIRDGENGFLASSPLEWEDKLRQLVEDADLRRAMGESAWEDVLQRYHPEVRLAELLPILDEISLHFLGRRFTESLVRSSVSLEPAGYAIGPEVERTPTLVQRGLYSLRYRGLRTLLVQVWVYLRRLAAPVFPFRKPWS